MLKIKDIAITLIMVIHALTKKMVVCSSTKCLLSVNFMHLVAKITKSRSKLRHSQSFLLVLFLGQTEQRCTHVRIVGCLYYTVQLSCNDWSNTLSSLFHLGFRLRLFEI